MYYFTRFLKTIGILLAAASAMALALFLSVIILDKLALCIEDVCAVSKETIVLPIMDEDYTRVYLGSEQAVFVVNYDGTKYTLPSVPANCVRTYHTGDTIPVKVIEYESGYISLSVDMTAIA